MCGALRLDVSTTLRSAQHDGCKFMWGKITIIRHPETLLLDRHAKDLAARRTFAAYLRRLTLLLLAISDLNDRQGLFSPVITKEPRHASIYTAKILFDA